MFYVYAIFNPVKKKVYIGQTEDLERRLKEHNDPNCQRHLYTKRIGPSWSLIYSETLSDRKSALIREKQLKSYQGRLFIKKYIPL